MALATISLMATSAPAWAQPASPAAAEVVGLQGSGEFRPTLGVDWRAAAMKQQLLAGQFVRTGELSRMGLLFVDQTQIRLNQSSLLQIKQVSTGGAGSSSTVLSLVTGRAWSQSKQAPKKLLLETPAATAAIRGTDWELSVDAQGASTLTVLSGEVEFYNDFGTVIVSQNQQATAQVGQAPVKLLISNPRDRVQWVTAYAVDPLRHIFLHDRRATQLRQDLATLTASSGAGSVALAGVLVDLGRSVEAAAMYQAALARDPADGAALLGLGFTAIHEGDVVRATELFTRAGRELNGAAGELLTLGRIAALIQAETFAPAVAALTALIDGPSPLQAAPYLLLADLMLYVGETAQAIDYIRRGQAQFAGDERLESELARIYLLADRVPEGRAQAEQALQKDRGSLEAYLALGDIAKREGHAAASRAAYLAALALKPDDARAWYGLGAVENEREAIRSGRADLKRALTLNPNGPGYRGELGTLETFANRLARAEQEYRQALAANPGDYVALTGLGLLELKRGRAAAALEALLKASLLEPRYARVHMYMAVAYYRQGRTDRALEELARASEIDPKDPLPHMLRSIVYSDAIDPARAIAAGRTARDLMPYLKSLNQLANNQRGTANLGSAFASFGMEEWALHLAQESYYPYWAGSHLFLGDRYAGSFNKNSEYFQGVLADPTVFGASTRYQTLLPKPGTYLNTGFRVGNDRQSVTTQPYFTVNGHSSALAPASYFFDVENTHLDPRDQSVAATQYTYTGALGVTPTHALGILGFGNYTGSTGRVTSGDLVNVATTLTEKKLDIGAQYRVGPTAIVWAKVGLGRELTAVQGPSNSKAFDFLFGVPIDVDLREVIDSDDVQIRHTFSIRETHEISWGAEIGARDTFTTFVVSPRILPRFRIPTTAPVEDDSQLVYVSDRVAHGPLVLQGDLFLHHYTRTASQVIDASLIDAGDIVTPEERASRTGLEPRVGVVYHFGSGRLIRAAHQRAVRPSSVSTLSPVATASLPLDDRLASQGGHLSRSRLQAEWEWTARTFTSAFVDHRTVKNLTVGDTLEGAPDLTSLRRLRNVIQANLAATDLLEDTPQFSEGVVRSSGAAVNQLLSQQWSVYARYLVTDSENTSERFGGLAVPWLPRHVVALGATWVGPRRVYIGGLMVHRTDRFQDEANQKSVAADWRGTVQGYWEAPSKQWSIEAVVNNLASEVERVGFGLDLKFRY